MHLLTETYSEMNGFAAVEVDELFMITGGSATGQFPSTPPISGSASPAKINSGVGVLLTEVGLVALVTGDVPVGIVCTVAGAISTWLGGFL